MMLNTVSVSATVDDGGRITSWFDKESGTRVLVGPWSERAGGQPVDWQLDAAGRSCLTYRSGALGKAVLASNRGVELQLSGGPVVTRLGLPGRIVQRRTDQVEVAIDRVRVSISGRGLTRLDAAPVAASVEIAASVETDGGLSVQLADAAD